MADSQKQGELLESVNNIIINQNKKLLEEMSNLMKNYFEKIAESSLENKLSNNVEFVRLTQKINILESAIGGAKKSIKSTTKTPAETGGEDATPNAATPSAAKKPTNKMTYFKNRMLVDTDYYNNVVKQVDAILKGKSQEIENSPAVISKKPNERRKAICQAYWTLISPGKELKPILDAIGKEYEDLKKNIVVDSKQPATPQLDKDKQSDEE